MEKLESTINLSGKVVHGQQLGRQLGFPTANIALPAPPSALPNGVYAAWAQLADGTTYRAMVNIGFRPTVDAGHRISIEAHLLGFSGQLYDQQLSLTLVAKMRDERKMHGLEELKKQLETDLKELADAPLMQLKQQHEL